MAIKNTKNNILIEKNTNPMAMDKTLKMSVAIIKPTKIAMAIETMFFIHLTFNFN